MRRMKRLAGAGLSLLLLFALLLPSCAAGEESGFTDTASDAWYAEAVRFCRERGLMNGISDTRFAPEGTLTRAQLVTVLYRMEASPAVTGDDAFTDTAAGQWYSAAVVWASQRGLVNGYGDGRFGPNDAVTQEQLALIFQRYTQLPVTQDIPGFDGSRTPATRAQTAAALMACVLGNQPPSDPAPAGGTKTEEGALTMNVTINGTTLTASLADNASARAFRDLLSRGPRTIKMNDYGSMEKVGPLGTTLPTSDQQITTQPGDIILYQGDQITIYYDRNTWNFTRLGKLEGIEAQALRTLLGSGSVEVTFSLD